MGFTVFGNEREERSITAWSADKSFEDQLGAAAQRVLGATFVKTSYSISEFQTVNDLNGPWDAPAFWGPNWSKIESATRSLCMQNSLDALLVVAKRKSQDFIGGTNQVITGAGIYARRNISVIHLLSVLALLDCQSGKPLATRLLARISPQTGDETLYSAPVTKISEELARIPVPQWTSETEIQVRESLLNLPQSAWEKTLRTMVPSK